MISSGLKQLCNDMKRNEAVKAIGQVSKTIANETVRTAYDCKIAVKEVLAENREEFYGGKTMREYYAECDEMKELKASWNAFKKAWNDNKKSK